jgi:hypothetical protein
VGGEAHTAGLRWVTLVMYRGPVDDSLVVVSAWTISSHLEAHHLVLSQVAGNLGRQVKHGGAATPQKGSGPQWCFSFCAFTGYGVMQPEPYWQGQTRCSDAHPAQPKRVVTAYTQVGRCSVISLPGVELRGRHRNQVCGRRTLCGCDTAFFLLIPADTPASWRGCAYRGAARQASQPSCGC